MAVILGFLAKHWRGQYSLARSYWLNGLLVSLFAPALGLMLIPFVRDQPARYASAAVLLVSAAGVLAWVWATCGTWRSATRRGGTWGSLAKLMLLVGAARAVLALVQMRAGLIEHGQVALGKQAGADFRLETRGDTIEIIGGMNDGAAAALQAALQAAPRVETVALSSTGGWMREGRLVAKAIADRKLATRAVGECSSACTVAFLAGTSRTLAPRSRLGFHRVRSIGSFGQERAPDLQETRGVYAALGLPPDFIDHIVATPPEKMWYPGVGELMRAHVITGHAEWEAARAELSSSMRASMSTGADVLRLPPAAFEGLLECELTARIAWLNGTGCSYMYDDKVTTREQHLRQQDACVKAAGSTHQDEVATVACSKRHVPNDWRVFEGMIAAGFLSTLPSSLSKPEAQARAACIAARYVSDAARTRCKPVDMNATKPERLYTTGYECLRRDRAFSAKLPQIMADCAR